jgi:uncharacterized protein YecT (DUF1311 family)
MLKQAALGLAMGLATMAHAATPYPNTENFGRDVDPKTPWFQACLRVENIQPAATPQVPTSCKTFDYYDKRHQATTSAAEWSGVRACAVAAKDNAVLAMLYANGLGVPRDLDLATQYACRAGGAYAEVSGRVEHLQALKTAPAATPYDQCDDATSGFMMGVCANVADGQADKIRNAYFARLRTQLPAPQVAAFDQLVAATSAFATARRGETDMTGTGRGAFSVNAEAREKEWLREHLAAFEKGTFKAPEQPLAAADAELNRVYKAMLAAPSDNASHPTRLPASTVEKADVRIAQRLWITYRDAWVRFAKLRYPALPPETLQAMLTDWRVKQFGRMWSGAR